MGEIKSTLDLVNEKMGKLTISPEERERYRREKVKDAARILFNRYVIEGSQKNLQALKQALEGVENGVKQVLVNEIVSHFSFEDPSPVLLEVLEMVLGDRRHEIAGALRRLSESYQREKTKGVQEIADQLRAELARRAITGSAVKLNPNASPGWADFIGQLKKKYEDKKKRLLDSVS